MEIDGEIINTGGSQVLYLLIVCYFRIIIREAFMNYVTVQS